MNKFNYQLDELFGRYCLIEQKRYGIPNEKFLYKIVGTLQSNAWSEVPVDANDRDKKLHDHSEEVVNVICCGICEERVERYRLCDVFILPKEQDTRWQDLKELLEADIQNNLEIQNELVQHAIDVEQWVLDKMEQLEAEDVED